MVPFIVLLCFMQLYGYEPAVANFFVHEAPWASGVSQRPVSDVVVWSIESMFFHVTESPTLMVVVVEPVFASLYDMFVRFTTTVTAAVGGGVVPPAGGGDVVPPSGGGVVVLPPPVPPAVPPPDAGAPGSAAPDVGPADAFDEGSLGAAGFGSSMSQPTRASAKATAVARRAMRMGR
jgi:hypothetical protein